MGSQTVLAETRFNRFVLGGWWLAVAVLSGLRLLHGDVEMATVLLVSSTRTALLGVALSIDRDRDRADEASNGEAYRLQKAIMLFSLIAITTVIACAFINGVMWWAALECAALVWILPAVILPLAQAYIRRRMNSRTSTAA